MTRIIPTIAPRSLSRFVVALLVLGTMLLGASSADAALTTGKCLAQKTKAWGNLRKCQATARAKILEGKVGDLTKCQTTFQSALTKITAKATKATIPCRYGANGDGTVTDYDTGLQWEQKDTAVSSGINFGNPHDVDNLYTWSATGTAADGAAFGDFLSRLNFHTAGGSGFQFACFAFHCDWRLPTLEELQSILDETALGCGGIPCIDPIFGPTTVAGLYWSATTSATGPGFARGGYFSVGDVGDGTKANDDYVRAVRAGL